MAINIIESFKNGDIDFIFRATYADLQFYIRVIRQTPNIIEVVDGFLDKLIDNKPNFCFDIIYDIDKYEEQVKRLLAKGIKPTKEQLIAMIKNTSWGASRVLENPDLIDILDDQIDELFNAILADTSNSRSKIAKLKIASNLHIRYLFMHYLIKNQPDMFKELYPNFLDYLTSNTYEVGEQLTLLPDYMSVEDICLLAIDILYSRFKDEYFIPLKEYILAVYPQNDLAAKLLEKDKVYENEHSYSFVESPVKTEVFMDDATRLFASSRTCKFEIYQNYPKLIADDVLAYYARFYQMFRTNERGELFNLSSHGLNDTLIHYIEKYLELSNDKTWGYIESGSTSSVYRMGDYVLKLITTKWSYEDVICPNLYLIVKNLEEIYIRNKQAIVIAGLEVQPYLPRSARGVSCQILGYFITELERLGYKVTDTLMYGSRGDNCRLLNDYHDADCKDPEGLPDWFKKTPLVLVDRDRIYPRENHYIRQLTQSY